MLNIYQISIFVLTLLKLKIKQCREPLCLNHATPSEVKSPAFPVSLC